MTAQAMRKIEPTIETWQGVDLVLKEIKQRNEEILKIQDSYTTRIIPLRQEIDRLNQSMNVQLEALNKQNQIDEQLIEKFTRDHASELSKNRTKKLTFGLVKLRKFTKTAWLTGADFEALLKRLLRMERFQKYITFLPRLDKRAFSADPEAEKYVNVISGDEFHYEIF